MTINYPGPYQVRVHYTTASRPHVQRLNVAVSGTPDPGLNMASYDFILRGGGTVQADTAIAAWIGLIDSLFNTATTNFTHYELWKYAPGTDDATFMSVLEGGATGASASAVVPAAQSRMSFISTEGGTMFIDFMETIHQLAVTDPYPFANADVQAVANFVISSSNWILAKDTSYPIAARNWNVGQNEALFKKIYRP